MNQQPTDKNNTQNARTGRTDTKPPITEQEYIKACNKIIRAEMGILTISEHKYETLNQKIETYEEHKLNAVNTDA